MIKKDMLIGITVFVLIVGGIVGFNIYRRHSAHHALAVRMEEFAPRGGGPPATIEDLRKAIALYDEEIQRHVRDASQNANYWRILAMRLQDRGLHADALDAFARAIELSPERAVLHHMRGVSAGVMATSSYDNVTSRGDLTMREYYFNLAEQSYLRAIQLDDDYGRPRFALGILYVFEMNRAEEAIPLLERFLEIQRNHIDAMFVLGRAYFVTGRYRQALEMYESILRVTRSEQRQIDAQNNIRTILGLLDG